MPFRGKTWRDHSMWILIDGYNVLFALGMIPATVQAGDLQKARLSLLNMLADGLGEESKRCIVVFDATRAPARKGGDTVYRGIDVRFTKRREEADDLIVWLIKQCSAPKQLTVISSDHRLVEATTRRKATSIKADRFLEWLEQRKPRPTEQATPATMTAEERAQWLQEFDHLDQEFRDERHYPEQQWKEGFAVSEDDLEDVRKRHRLKKKGESR
jgi:predicted RNA-binding protein with PIN domain